MKSSTPTDVIEHSRLYTIHKIMDPGYKLWDISEIIISEKKELIPVMSTE